MSWCLVNHRDNFTF